MNASNVKKSPLCMNVHRVLVASPCRGSPQNTGAKTGKYRGNDRWNGRDRQRSQFLTLKTRSGGQREKNYLSSLAVVPFKICDLFPATFARFFSLENILFLLDFLSFFTRLLKEWIHLDKYYYLIPALRVLSRCARELEMGGGRGAWS